MVLVLVLPSFFSSVVRQDGGRRAVQQDQVQAAAQRASGQTLLLPDAQSRAGGTRHTGGK